MTLKLKLLKQVYKPSESEIKRDIRKYLQIRGIFYWNQWQGQFSVEGVPDLICIFPPGTGKILGIEVKVPGWKPTKRWPKQEAFLKRIIDEGGTAFVATSVQDVIEKLSEHRNG